MKIEDLPAPVTASKADWLAATTWIGFTPTDDNLNAINMCQSTIQRQFDNGYVIEYITEQFSQPNPGFELDPAYVQEREAHKDLAGRLIAVHRLRTTSRALEDVIGVHDFRKLQDMWAHDGKRCRWSVAFPIVETYKIIGHPKAKAVFGDAMYRSLYQRSSATLRVLNEHERVAIASLEIESLHTDNAWIGIEDEISFAEKSQIEPRTERLIREDLSDRALEGMTEERRTKIRRRAAWIAERFIRERRRTGKLICDHCAFDPKTVLDPQKVNPRC